MAEYKFWQRRETRSMKVAKTQKAAAAASILEAIAQLSGGAEAAEGPKVMKIVMKKEDLKQALEAIRDGRSGLVRRGPPSTAAAMSLEQWLNFMRRRQILRAAGQGRARNRSGSWRPVKS
ncbi:uncharacterized protein LOC131020890 [Salvia miltiorrhiza]|uniref:uncharacterized protein LOC131020890 n=1 Tax=Salvia miltiorrhiza TaxID=226208 RepID=UPI0025ACEB5F|nr:uncharacterized protein LOC131020890 [Salvia miltiorrhiza]